MKQLILSILFCVLLVLCFSACDTSEMENQVAQAEEQLAQARAELDEMLTEKPGLIHTVFFWLNEEVSPEEREAFMAGCRELGQIEAVAGVHVGPPAPTPDRDVVDHSYDVALILHFEDMVAHDGYQEAPAHQDFIDAYQHLWERVQVYDTDVQ